MATEIASGMRTPEKRRRKSIIHHSRLSNIQTALCTLHDDDDVSKPSRTAQPMAYASGIVGRPAIIGNSRSRRLVESPWYLGSTKCFVTEMVIIRKRKVFVCLTIASAVYVTVTVTLSKNG